MAAPPKFKREDRPPYIVNTSGLWLASELGPGFQWVESARALRMTIAPARTGEIQLRPSHWNRSGELTHATVQVAIRDRELAKWRRRRGQTSSGIVANTSSDVIWCIPLINIDQQLEDVELFGDVARATGYRFRHHYMQLSELLVAIRTRILPKLRMFESPARAARELPDIWLAQPGPMIEWATSLGDDESARVIATRAKKLKGELPPESDLEVLLAQGRRLLEMLRAESRRTGLMAGSPFDPGLTTVNQMVKELSDPVGRADRVPEGALARWAATLPVDSSIRVEAMAFAAAAALHAG